jgi:hypothetical protein
MYKRDCEHRTSPESDKEIEYGSVYFFKKKKNESSSRYGSEYKKRKEHRKSGYE